ncbi:MAG: SDR family NAD(P)-dependent oxidoreductase [Cyclobacteriaceae bacterium]
MQILFENKVVVVTGGASGIGKACSQLFLQGQAKVIILDLESKANVVGEMQDESLFFFPCDLGKPEEIKATFQKISQQFPVLDVLINNAGIQTYGRLGELSEELWDHTLNINTKAYFLCSKYALPLLSKATAPVIIHVASVKTQFCQKDELAYVTSKAAILGLSRSIASDYAPKLRCLTVSPGAVDTPLLKDELAGHPQEEEILEATKNIHLLKRLATAEEVANVIYFLASEKASFVTGHEYRVDGGIGIQIQGI